MMPQDSPHASFSRRCSRPASARTKAHCGREPRTGCADLSKTAGIDGDCTAAQGECMFTTKSLNAEAAGAVGVLVATLLQRS